MESVLVLGLPVKDFTHSKVPGVRIMFRTTATCSKSFSGCPLIKSAAWVKVICAMDTSRQLSA